MAERRMGTVEFKAHCLDAINDAEKHGQSLTITRQGKAVARLVPVGSEKKPLDRDALAASFRIVGDIVSPSVEPHNWDATN